MKLPAEHLVDPEATAELAKALLDATDLGLGVDDVGTVGTMFLDALPDIITVEFIMAWLVEAGYKTANAKLLPVAKVLGPKEMEIKLLHRELHQARIVRDRYRQTMAVALALAKEGDTCHCKEVTQALTGIA